MSVSSRLRSGTHPPSLDLSLNFASAIDSALFTYPAAGGRIQVEAQTLYQIAEHEVTVDFIKVDVEGAETKAILRAKGLLQRTRPRLAFDVEN